MKKTFLSILTITTLLLVGCNNTTNNKLVSDTTRSTTFLTSFFKKYQAGSNAGNEIQKQEIYDKREKELMQYIDSFAIFTNIKGTIESIRLYSNDTNDKKALMYHIKIKPDQSLDITFDCANMINSDSLETDYLYNAIKNIPEQSTVYFDGIISINGKKNTPRASNLIENLAFDHPEYKFHVIDISTSQLSDSISPNLKTSIHTGRKTLTYLFRQFRNEDYNDKQFGVLTEEFNQTREALTPDEYKYVTRYMNGIYFDLAD